jgi:hypothetical protein
MEQVNILRGKEQDKGRERMREKGERVRDRVWLEKGCGVSHKFDCWSSIQGFRNRIILEVNLNAYQDNY